MWTWLEPPILDDEEKDRRGQLVYRLLLTMGGLVFFGFASSFLEERNDPTFSLFFYAGISSILIGLGWLVKKGWALAAAWILSLSFWALIAFVTLFFGGMQGQNAAVFTVSVLLIGGVVGGRAALGLALVSSAWCALVAWLEVHDSLPRQLSPYSPMNGWSAVTVTLILTTVLLRSSMESLRRVHERAQASARERDEALRRSIQGQKMELVGNLTSGIAHDFNNLLTVIGSASQALREELPRLDGESRAWLDDLDGATSRATLMTRQLLSFGRAPRGKQSVVDLSSVVRELERMLPRLLGSAIQIDTRIEGHAYVRASRADLEQVLLNLAVNARDAMPEGGRLTLEVRIDGDEVVLLSKDSGVGMDEATQERIFEPFFTTKQTGTGLGLATVRELVQASGGSIHVHSLLGVGSTFEVRFPRTEPEPDAPPVPSSERLATSMSTRQRILLVEDDPLVRRGVARWLSHEGYEVIPVVDGEEALGLVRTLRGELTCVVSDISMPRMDGERLAEELMAIEPELPVVLMSGNRAPSPRILGDKRVFIEKPVDLRMLSRVIEKVSHR